VADYTTAQAPLEKLKGRQHCGTSKGIEKRTRATSAYISATSC